MACQNGCKGCGVARLWEQYLAPVASAGETLPLVEVRFKGSRRELFWSSLEPPLKVGEWVVVPEIIRRGEAVTQIGKGYDIGQISLTGYLDERRRSTKANLAPQQKILRRATPEEVEKLLQRRAKEPQLLQEIRQLIKELELDTAHQMKLSDVEFSGDGKVLWCYFTAEDRVDFRELVRRIADRYKVRPEMRQIKEREESGRLGGIGACGRELCCTTWLTTLPTVSTEAARYQGFSLSSTKIVGLCGKLKCCLTYELDTYREIVARLPEVKQLRTGEGEWHYLRTELLLERLWFLHPEEGRQVCLPADKVTYLAQLNAQGQIPPSIEPYIVKFPDLPTRI
ncbi:MAG: Signal peptidase-like protein [Bacteroidia bacterium]|nr:Signal peptidase-like protein [Bacteroidia bacterium]MDW8088206.1 regulatory iron-sulfur-containing complex subunit RicT [Bacteroidia bacterium]